MPAAGSEEVKRLRMASPLMPGQTPTSTMSASSSAENQQQNPISLLNQYKTGLVYRVVGEYGPPHLKTFTVELTIDEQVGVISCSLSMFYALCAFKEGVLYAFLKAEHTLCYGIVHLLVLSLCLVTLWFLEGNQ